MIKEINLSLCDHILTSAVLISSGIFLIILNYIYVLKRIEIRYKNSETFYFIHFLFSLEE